jgi:hypothetical protein
MVVDGRALEPTYAGRGMPGAWTWLGGSAQSISKGVRVLSTDFHGVSDPAYTRAGELAFGRRLGNDQVVVAVGDRQGPFLDDLVSSIVVSRDGEHLAYVGKKGDAFVEVRDQMPGRTFAAKRPAAIVPWIGMSEAGRLAYSIVLGGAEFKAGRSARALRRVVVDGVAGPEYDALGITPALTGATGEPLAYVVIGAEGRQDRLVLNGRETRLYDDVIGGSIRFLPPSGVEFVARQGRQLLHVRIDPATGS